MSSFTPMFSIISNPYLKTALNSDHSVKIGTRIFKFYDNGGIAIVLNNDTAKFNAIKSLNYNDLVESGNLIVTSDAKEEWDRYYFISYSGEIGNEKTIVFPDMDSLIAACDFSKEIKVIKLNGGAIRFEVPNIILNPGENFYWAFSDGQTAVGNPVTKTFTSSGTGTVELRRADGSLKCWGSFTYKADCGMKKEVNRTKIFSVKGETWKLEASLWVKSGEVGARMKYLRKGFLGKFYPMYNQGVNLDMNGYYQRKGSSGSCSDVFVSKSKALGGGTYPTSISVTQSDISNIFVAPTLLSAGAKVKVDGTWFGFGVGAEPRLILN